MIVSSAQDGGDTTLFVSLPDLADERYFLYDLDQNYITIGDLEQGAAVSRNPDGSYELWTFVGETNDNFLTVPNGFEALKVVEQYNSFKGISPYILLTAFAFAHHSTFEARSPMPCGDTAATPVVCDIFKESCDCAACSVLNKAGACDQCPNL